MFGLDNTTFTFAMFFIGLLVGVVVPAIAQWDPTPNVQRGVQLFLGFMALLVVAVTGGATVAPSAIVGILLGYSFASQAKLNSKIRMLLKEVEGVK
jgi:O-antigen/teichoic acid export membrane protein